MDRFSKRAKDYFQKRHKNNKEDKTTAHAKFEAEISDMENIKTYFLENQLKKVSLEMNRQKFQNLIQWQIQKKIAQMRKKMDGKVIRR